MDTWRLVDVGVSFTFFLLLFVRPVFFFFLGGLAIVFLLPNFPMASIVRSGQIFFGRCRVFFLESF